MKILRHASMNFLTAFVAESCSLFIPALSQDVAVKVYNIESSKA